MKQWYFLFSILGLFACKTSQIVNNKVYSFQQNFDSSQSIDLNITNHHWVQTKNDTVTKYSDGVYSDLLLEGILSFEDKNISKDEIATRFRLQSYDQTTKDNKKPRYVCPDPSSYHLLGKLGNQTSSVDSVSGSEKKVKIMSTQLLQNLSSILSVFKQKHYLKVGDTISTLQLQAQISKEHKMQTTYELLSVRKQQATFSFSIQDTLPVSCTELDVNGSGSILYDMNSQRIKSIDTHTQVYMYLPFLDLTTKITRDYLYQFSYINN